MATSKTAGTGKTKRKGSKTKPDAKQADVGAGLAAYPEADKLEAAIEPGRPFGLLYLIRADNDVHEELATAARRVGGSVGFYVHVDRLFIGDGDLPWTHIALLDFGQTGALVAAAREATERLSAVSLSIYPFRPAMRPALLQTALGAARILGAVLDTGDADLARTLPLAEADRPEILPSSEQVRICASDTREAPACFVNFLSYRERAVYADGCDRGRSGRAAYMRYGLGAILAVRAMGGRIIRAGLCGAPLTDGPESAVGGSWDEIAIVRYPTPRTVLKLHRIPGYRAGTVHRDAGLERTALIVASEAF